MLNLRIVNCFCDETPGSGNPAAVVSEFSGSNAEKQKLATQLNLPVTVFISEFNASEPTLEYFYPNAQMPLCLHGTIGAAKVLFDLNGSEEKTLRTKSGLHLNLIRNGDVVQVQTMAVRVPAIQWSPHEISRMLGIEKADIAENLPYTVASVGSPKLLVPLVSPELLKKVTPNFDAITRWSMIHDINGMYIYASMAQSTNSFVARGFNPKAGHHEDAATGVAAAALAVCLQHDFFIKQGNFIGRPSHIIVTYKHESEIWVGGRVEEIML